MTKEDHRPPEMSLNELFASARAAGNVPHVVSLRVHFCLQRYDIDHGTLTVTRNPSSRRWLTTLGVTQGKHYYACFAHGKSAAEALDRIEQQCQGWLE